MSNRDYLPLTTTELTNATPILQGKPRTLNLARSGHTQAVALVRKLLAGAGLALSLLVATPADAGKRASVPRVVDDARSVSRITPTPEVKVAKLAARKAKAAAKRANHVLKLARVKAAYNKAAVKLEHEQNIEDCIDERTGPVGGIDEDEAMELCEAEVE